VSTPILGPASTEMTRADTSPERPNIREALPPASGHSHSSAPHPAPQRPPDTDLPPVPLAATWANVGVRSWRREDHPDHGAATEYLPRHPVRDEWRPASWGIVCVRGQSRELPRLVRDRPDVSGADRIRGRGSPLAPAGRRSVPPPDRGRLRRKRRGKGSLVHRVGPLDARGCGSLRAEGRQNHDRAGGLALRFDSGRHPPWSSPFSTSACAGSSASLSRAVGPSRTRTPRSSCSVSRCESSNVNATDVSGTGEAFEALGAVVVLDEERQAGVSFGPDAVGVGADDLAPLPGAAPLGPPLVEPTAGPAASRSGSRRTR